MWLLALLIRRLALLGSLHRGKKLSPDPSTQLASSQVEQRSLLFEPLVIQSRRGPEVARHDNTETSDKSLQLRCYHCQACANIQRLLYIGNSKSRDDINEQYNMLKPAAQLIQRDCEPSFFDGKYVMVQYLYDTWKAEQWQRELSQGYPVAACFDNS